MEAMFVRGTGETHVRTSFVWALATRNASSPIPSASAPPSSCAARIWSHRSRTLFWISDTWRN